MTKIRDPDLGFVALDPGRDPHPQIQTVGVRLAPSAEQHHPALHRLLSSGARLEVHNKILLPHLLDPGHPQHMLVRCRGTRF